MTSEGAGGVDPVRLLASRAGRYRGEGTGSAGELFTAALTVAPVAGGAAVAIDLVTAGPDADVQHEEHGVLAPGDDRQPRYCTVTSNAPFHRAFGLRRAGSVDGQALAVFGWGGPPEATSGFREEITFVVHDGGDIAVAWAYGTPGEPFAPRSAVRLHPD